MYTKKMDFLNLNTANQELISAVTKSQFFTSCKEYDTKDIYRIGRKGIKIIANKLLDKNGNFLKYQFLKISLKPHFFYNDDLHNANHFPHNKVIEVLKEICNKLNIKKPNLLTPTSADYGINLTPDQFDSKDIIRQSLYYGKRPMLIRHTHLPFFKTTKEIGSHPTIGAKIYHKGLEFPNYAHENTFRYENMFASNRKLNQQFSINSFADFFDIDLYEKFADYILKSWDNLLILDYISEEYGEHNPDYYDNRRHYRNGLTNAKKNYYKIHGNCHREMKKLLEYTIEQNYRNVQIHTIIDSWNPHTTTKNTIENTPQIKKCNITGLNIEMQKENSVFLCNKGLKYYIENDDKIFRELKKKYLTESKRNLSLDEQIYYIAHNIRNTNSNVRNNRLKFERRNYHPNQLQFNFS